MKNIKIKRIITAVILVLIALVLVLFFMSKRNYLNHIDIKSAQAEYTTKIGNQTFDILNLIETNPVPRISAGMIPVKWDGEKWRITTKEDNNWYDYNSGTPAYMMLNDGTYKSEAYYNMPSEKILAENNIGLRLDEYELGSIYMWIPKFAYDENAEEKLIYIKEECIIDGSYKIPEIFEYEIDEKKIMLSGIWVEINETESENALSTKVVNMNKGEEDSVYGFLAQTKANAMTADEQTQIQTYLEYMYNINSDVEANNELTINIANKNRTIIKILDLTNTEPIDALATYNEITEKIDIEVTYNKNMILQIISKEALDITYINQEKTMVDTGTSLIGNGIYRFYIQDEVGNIKEIILKVTASNVYNIYDIETLQLFRDAVNSGKADIIGNQIANIEIQSTDTALYPWEPIGYISPSNIKQYSGTYYGNGYSISGIDSKIGGFFSYLNGATIKNLNITNSVINMSSSSLIYSSYKFTGGLADRSTGNILVENCYINADLECTTSNWTVGGLIGYYGIVSTGLINDLTIRDCSFDGNIKMNRSSEDYYTGGIIGSIRNANEVIIENCYNSANINHGYNGCGGIVGTTGYLYTNTNNNKTTPYGANKFKIYGCYNAGKIFSDNYSQHIGGIIGFLVCKTNDVEIKNCYNAGEINGAGKSSNYCGGIVGYSGYTVVNIEKCYNIGNINYKTGRFGGIVGSISNGGGNITNCYNNGNITILGPNIGGGGIAGSISGDEGFNIIDCYNCKDIDVDISVNNYRYNANIAGIVGYTSGSSTYNINIKNCYNIGNIMENSPRSRN